MAFVPRSVIEVCHPLYVTVSRGVGAANSEYNIIILAAAHGMY